jgi:RES domain-containing protein
MLKIAVPAVTWTGFTASELASRNPNWRVEGNALCRNLGDIWLLSQASCVLMVPSAANPDDYNVLFNPEHFEFARVLAANVSMATSPVELDERVVSLARARRAAGL